jgi:putative phage-type endonuclease
MRILPFEQGSPEWLEFRKTKVTASDIPILMMGSEKEIRALYDEKLGIKKRFKTDAMLKGSAMEPEAIEWFFGKRKKIERPCVMNESCDWFMASLDALHFPTMTLAEIKCPSTAIPEKIEDHPLYQKAYWQMQGQFYATGLDEGWIVLYSPLRQKKALIKRNEADIRKMLEVGHEFYERLVYRNPPPVSELEDRKQDKEIADWAQRYAKAYHYYKIMEEQIALLREEGINRANGEPFMCEGVKVEATKGREIIDFKKALDQLKPVLPPDFTLDPFTKVSEPGWRITVTKSV